MRCVPGRPGAVGYLLVLILPVFADFETTKLSHMPAWTWPGTPQIIICLPAVHDSILPTQMLYVSDVLAGTRARHGAALFRIDGSPTRGCAPCASLSVPRIVVDGRTGTHGRLGA